MAQKLRLKKSSRFYGTFLLHDMEIIGKITAVGPIESGTAANGQWSRCTIIVEYESGQYPRSLAITNKKNPSEFSRLQVGQVGTFKIDCRAREYNGKFYNDITCWSWKLNAAPVTPSNEPF